MTKYRDIVVGITHRFFSRVDIYNFEVEAFRGKSQSLYYISRALQVPCYHR